MLPEFTNNNGTDRRLVHAVLFCQLILCVLARCVCGANITNIAVRQDGPSIALSAKDKGSRVSARLPTLGSHVRKIVSARSEEHVGGVYARPIVALVADIEAVLNRAVGEFPRYSVCRERSPVSTACANLAVAVALARGPVPTGIRPTRFINLGPEAIPNGYPYDSHARPFRVWSGAGPAASTATGSVYLCSDYNMLANAGA